MLKKTALIAFVAGLLSLPLPVWNAVTQTLEVIGSAHRQWIWLLIPVVVLALTVTATMPAFCFALYRNERTLRIPKRLRSLSLAAAIILAGVVAVGSVDLIRSVGIHSPVSQVAGLLGELSNLSFILLLTAFFRQTDIQTYNGAPVSRFLTLTTNVAVIAWAVFLLGLLLGLVLTPYGYFQLLRDASPKGRMLPPLAPSMMQAVRRLVAQACLFAVPYIVYRSLPHRPGDV